MYGIEYPNHHNKIDSQDVGQRRATLSNGATQNCAFCHGATGANVNPLLSPRAINLWPCAVDINNDGVIDERRCETIAVLTNYLNTYMPLGAPTSCRSLAASNNADSCADDIAVYMWNSILLNKPAGQ